jgi:hypothetical protein
MRRMVIKEDGSIEWDAFSATMVAEGQWELAGVDFDVIADSEIGAEDVVLSAWQYLVDTGLAWSLQGWFGRTARNLIEAGLITPA